VSRPLFKKTPRASFFLAISVALLVALSLQRIRRAFPVQATTPQPASSNSYLGFDRNDYPGDENLAALRRTFAFMGYWLNAPPGATTNTWTGKREVVKNAGFGFLVLFNGRLDAELKRTDPQSLGRSDAAAALESAQREGFPKNTVIFLDQEEGGRMLPEQNAYIFAWVDAVNRGGFRAGIYCSGIRTRDGSGTVVTADDIRQHANGRPIVYWIANDACPPSPGCVFPQRPPLPQQGDVSFAEVWQFAQSPRRKDFARGCRATYDKDGNCYPPGLTGQKLLVDVNSADSQDPSGGR
jgi:hypothetical protein